MCICWIGWMGCVDDGEVVFVLIPCGSAIGKIDSEREWKGKMYMWLDYQMGVGG